MSDMNTVSLTGRLSSHPRPRELPSGDLVVSFRLVVPRATAARRRLRQTVDVIECSVWTARLRRTVAALGPGDEISVTGELRRTFRRNAAGVGSWVTVDVDAVRRAGTASGT